jgi:hypothetical protein
VRHDYTIPYSASHRVFSRQPRRSKNGTPEERAAKAAASSTAAAAVIEISPRRRGLYTKERAEMRAAELRELHDLLTKIDKRRLGTVLRILREAQ